MAMQNHVFVVKRATALFEAFDDKFMDIVGIFMTLKDANNAVRLCQKEFTKEFGISDPSEEGEFVGFRWEDRGESIGGKPAPTGTPVGLSWEFDCGDGWYLCGVECFPLVASSSEDA
jgi:hypothetical protein